MEKNPLDGAEAVIICKNKGEPTPFTDNKDTECILCGQELICRNYVNLEEMRPLCMACGLVAMIQCGDPLDRIQAHPNAQDEFDKMFGDGMTEKAIENAKLMVLMSKALGPMEEYTCELCGETYTKGRTDEDALAELEREHPGAKVEDCAIICHDCHERLVAKK